jgi:hypothetical protein
VDSLRFPRRIERRLRLTVAVLACVAAVLAVLGQSAQADAAATGPTDKEAAAAVVVRVRAPSAAQLRALSATYDVLEVRRGGDYFVLGDGSTARS